ncbi:MAG: homoserine kinase [Bacteroidota bacterium]
MNSGLKVFAPASVANLGVGYDILGLALEKPGDEIIVRFNNDRKGLAITKITGASGKLPTDVDQNTAGVAAMALLEHLGETERGIDMEIHKKMPFASGLGSSAASAAGAVMAINELFRRPLQKRALLPFAVLGEQAADGAYHADNVGPSLLGGIALIRGGRSLDFQRIPYPAGLYVVVLHPKVQIKTKEARGILSDQVALSNVIEQTGNLAGLVIGLYNTDLELIKRCLNDVLIEPQRAKLIPHFAEIKDKALNAGALGCSISGAGPSIFALCANSIIAEDVSIKMQNVLQKNKIDSNLYVSKINSEGAILL